MTNAAAVQFSRGRTRDGGDPYNALELIGATHKAATSLLRDYRRRRSVSTTLEKGKRALRICRLLSIHGAIKREIFYPSAERVLGSKASHPLLSARTEQDTIDGLIDRIEAMPARHELFDWTVDTLARHAALQFRIEEADLFPKLRHSKLDLRGLGEQLASRQLELATRPVNRRGIAKAKRVMRG